MEWFKDLIREETSAHTILLYSIIISAGVFLGRRKVGGVSLGITFVLFAGIAAGHFGFSADHQVIEFIRDFGLILFVFSIGLQVGPGFFSSFKKGGLALNLLAMTTVFLGGAVTLALFGLTGMPLPMLIGIMSGAVTNTPGLGAAQNTLNQVFNSTSAGSVPEIGLGYAVAYPFGVLGIIISMMLIKRILKINTSVETENFRKEQYPDDTMPEKINILVTNPRVFNRQVAEVSILSGREIIISRMLHNGEIISPASDTVIHENDIILVVARKGSIGEITEVFGTRSDMDLSSGSGNLISRRIIVTNSNLAGKTLGSLKLRSLYNINITRIYRSGIELVASPQIRLQMGDALTIVGDEESLEKVTGQLGNSMKRLDEPNIIPIFLGIILGVILGSIPVNIPGMGHPLKLGMAAGPLLIAILLSKYGYRFSLVSYTTASANLMLREIGIVLFLASVGIISGEKFISVLTSGEGFVWMGYGAVITMFPILVTGFFARIVMKRNYFEICGLLAGSMTDPPALAFANSISQSEAPSVAYATVYPLVMFLRIFIAQLLVLFFI